MHQLGSNQLGLAAAHRKWTTPGAESSALSIVRTATAHPVDHHGYQDQNSGGQEENAPAIAHVNAIRHYVGVIIVGDVGVSKNVIQFLLAGGVNTGINLAR